MRISKQVFSFFATLFILAFPVIAFASRFDNPLENTPNIESALVRLINFMLGLIFLLSVAAFIYGGIMYTISLGNDSRVGTAKKTIFWAITGFVVSLLSVLLVRFVAQTVGLEVK